MKGIDLLCASPASTAICVSTTTTEHHSMVRHGHGGRKLDRHNPHLRDNRRAKPTTNVSSSSSPHQLPHNTTTKPNNKHHKNHKTRKTNTTTKPSPQPPPPQQQNHDMLIGTSPSGSSRYLLGDTAFYDVLSEFEPISTLLPTEPTTSTTASTLELNNYDVFDDSPALLNPFSSSSSTTSTSTFPDQVVMLRVSLHCKGCEGKVRKHISRMKGVKSYSIDFQAKKVTVIGDVTPLGVLASVSRVKRAQFWHSPSSLSVTSNF